jgi:hypothetical protein
MFTVGDFEGLCLLLETLRVYLYFLPLYFMDTVRELGLISENDREYCCTAKRLLKF